MNERERFLFDLHGCLVLEDVLTTEEVAAANAAIEHHVISWKGASRAWPKGPSTWSPGRAAASCNRTP